MPETWVTPMQFRRLDREVNPPGVEKLHYIGCIERKSGAEDYPALLGTLPTDHLLVFAVENERLVFICPSPRACQQVWRAIATLLALGDPQ